MYIVQIITILKSNESKALIFFSTAFKEAGWSMNYPSDLP